MDHSFWTCEDALLTCIPNKKILAIGSMTTKVQEIVTLSST